MIRTDQKLYCANNLVAMIVSGQMEEHPEKSQQEIMGRFCRSETYRMLYDFTTGLWKEGPDYLAEMWEDEERDRSLGKG